MNRSENQFNNVYDLTASRIVKNKTGHTVPIKLDTIPTTADEEAHMDSVIREENQP